jgi:hypothetical protein
VACASRSSRALSTAEAPLLVFDRSTIAQETLPPRISTFGEPQVLPGYRELLLVLSTPPAASCSHSRHREHVRTPLPRSNALQNDSGALGHIRGGSGSGGRRLPAFVLNEFGAYLRYGIPAHGFLRVQCRRRGVHPSCPGRRMADTAGFLRGLPFCPRPHSTVHALVTLSAR